MRADEDAVPMETTFSIALDDSTALNDISSQKLEQNILCLLHFTAHFKTFPALTKFSTSSRDIYFWLHRKIAR